MLFRSPLVALLMLAVGLGVFTRTISRRLRLLLPPMLRNVKLNCVYASNVTTYGETILGSSAATPNQSFQFSRAPVLPGQEIWVKERERPPGPDLEALAAHFGENYLMDAPDGDGVLVRWREVESLYESTPADRHYIKDVVTSEVKFGDGIHGQIGRAHV